MRTFAEIESSAKNLPMLEHQQLLRALTSSLQKRQRHSEPAQGRRMWIDYLLKAPAHDPGTPQTTP
jgi:hypothetical protein